MKTSAYLTYPEFTRRYFAQRVQKISVNPGFSCPNRDGKISVGGCQFASGNVTVKNANGEVVSEFAGSTGACYRGDESAIAYGYYKGEAGAIEVSFGSYAHTLSIVPVDPSEIVEEVEVKFSLGECGAEGQLPKDFKAVSAEILKSTSYLGIVSVTFE